MPAPYLSLCFERPALGYPPHMSDQTPYDTATMIEIGDSPGWRYHELATGHDAMLTQPGAVADMLLASLGPAA